MSEPDFFEMGYTAGRDVGYTDGFAAGVRWHECRSNPPVPVPPGFATGGMVRPRKPARLGSATLELKADTSELDGTLKAAEQRCADAVHRMQRMLDGLHAELDRAVDRLRA